MKSQTTESGQDQELGRKASSDSDMQGQLGQHENQVSSRGSSSTTAAMDDPQTVPQPTSAAPQIRSRITVVCAECKRLKLKCDRRTPCGSCTKRDTVSRCIYSPAAAEKVDLHSINNRLIQVETLLSMITAGKTPPPFQSSYPFAQVPIVSSHSATARPSHVASNTASPISIRLDDLVNIWLAHCQLDVFMPGNQASVKSETPQDDPFVKLEQPPVELLHLSDSGSQHEDTIPIDQGPSTSSNDASTTRRSLPSLHLYHTQAQEESSYNSRDTYPCDYTASQMLSSTPSSRQPSVTPTIFAHLPPRALRMRLLTSACSAIPHLSLLINRTTMSELADLGTATPERDFQRTSANAIFDARSGSRSPSPSPVPSNSALSLPLFACVCYLLALGALESPRDASVDHSFLYALAGQAMGIWEQHRSSNEEENSLDSVDGSVDASRAKQAEKENDNLDHVVALLLQVKYLLRTGPATSLKILSEVIFPLIGKLVNTARGLGLACDPESDAGVRKNAKVEERQRIIWWDIMFYDTFTSDVLGQIPLITLYSYNTRIPVIACSPSYPSSSCKQFDEGADGDESDSSGERGEDERWPLFAKATCLSKARVPPRFISQPKTKNKTKVASSISDNADTGFFGVRCRLTRLAQTLNHRLAHPGCDCCTCGSGYTLDQAAKLEAEVRAWASGLPSDLRLEFSSSETKSPRHTIIAAELAVLANRMIISAYIPLMRPPHDSVASSSTSVYSAAHPWSPASRATVDAAQSVVRAARVQHRLMRAGNAPSFMCGFYPLQKAVSDALVICAHSGFASTKPGRTIVLMEEVKVALEVLGTIGPPEGEMSRLLASMKRRIESGDVCRKDEENTLKRKHVVLEALQLVEQRAEVNGQIEVTSLAADSANSYVKANDNLSARPQQDQTHRPVIPPSPQRHSSVSRSNNGNNKRHAKKPLYPAIGFRDRGKDNAPWMMKKVNRTKTESPIPESPVTNLTSLSEMHTNNFQPQRLSPIQHPINQPIVNNSHRSRSSSLLSQTSPLQSSEYPSYPTEEQDEDMHTSQRRRFSTNNACQDQPRQSEQIQQSFIVSGSTPYIRSQQSSRTASYDAPHSFDQPHRSFDQTSTNSDGTYGGPPSPYANSSSGPLSTASSPYGSTGHPQTPVMYPSSNSHCPSPPAFVQQPAISSPQTYYHMPSGYEAQYEGPATQQQEVLRTDTMDSPMPSQVSTTTGEAMITQVSRSLPIYEKTQQHIIYDGETPVEIVQQQQMHHYHAASERVTPADHLAMNASIPQAWATTQYMQSQQSLVEHQDSQYWSTGQTYYS